jgi:hypothetical protein
MNGHELRHTLVVRQSTTTDVDAVSVNAATPHKAALHLPLLSPANSHVVPMELTFLDDGG